MATNISQAQKNNTNKSADEALRKIQITSDFVKEIAQISDEKKKDILMTADTAKQAINKAVANNKTKAEKNSGLNKNGQFVISFPENTENIIIDETKKVTEKIDNYFKKTVEFIPVASPPLVNPTDSVLREENILLTHNLEATRTDLNFVREELIEKTRIYNNAQTTITRLNNKLARLQGTLTDIENNVLDTETKLGLGHGGNIVDRSKFIFDLANTLQLSLTQTTASLNTAVADKNNLYESIHGRGGLNDQLQNQRLQNQQKLSAANTSIRNQEQKINLLMSQLTNLKEVKRQFDELQLSISNGTQINIQQLTRNIADVQLKMKSLRNKQKTQVSDAVEYLKKELKERELEITKLTEEKEELTQIIIAKELEINNNKEANRLEMHRQKERFKNIVNELNKTHVKKKEQMMHDHKIRVVSLRKLLKLNKKRMEEKTSEINKSHEEKLKQAEISYQQLLADRLLEQGKINEMQTQEMSKQHASIVADLNRKHEEDKKNYGIELSLLESKKNDLLEKIDRDHKETNAKIEKLKKEHAEELLLIENDKMHKNSITPAEIDNNFDQRIKELEAELNTSKEKAESLKNEVDILTQTNNQYMNQLSELNSLDKSTQMVYDDLNNKLPSKQVLNNISNELDKKVEHAEIISQQIDEIKRELNISLDVKQSASRDLNDIKIRIMKLQASNTSLSQTNDDLIAKNNQLQEQINSYIKQIKSLEQELTVYSNKFKDFISSCRRDMKLASLSDKKMQSLTNINDITAEMSNIGRIIKKYASRDMQSIEQINQLNNEYQQQYTNLQNTVKLFSSIPVDLGAEIRNLTIYSPTNNIKKTVQNKINDAINSVLSSITKRLSNVDVADVTANLTFDEKKTSIDLAEINRVIRKIDELINTTAQKFAAQDDTNDDGVNNTNDYTNKAIYTNNTNSASVNNTNSASVNNTDIIDPRALLQISHMKVLKDLYLLQEQTLGLDVFNALFANKDNALQRLVQLLKTQEVQNSNNSDQQNTAELLAAVPQILEDFVKFISDRGQSINAMVADVERLSLALTPILSQLDNMSVQSITQLQKTIGSLKTEQQSLEDKLQTTEQKVMNVSNTLSNLFMSDSSDPRIVQIIHDYSLIMGTEKESSERDTLLKKYYDDREDEEIYKEIKGEIKRINKRINTTNNINFTKGTDSANDNDTDSANDNGTDITYEERLAAYDNLKDIIREKILAQNPELLKFSAKNELARLVDIEFNKELEINQTNEDFERDQKIIKSHESKIKNENTDKIIAGMLHAARIKRRQILENNPTLARLHFMNFTVERLGSVISSIQNSLMTEKEEVIRLTALVNDAKVIHESDQNQIEKLTSNVDALSAKLVMIETKNMDKIIEKLTIETKNKTQEVERLVDAVSKLTFNNAELSSSMNDYASKMDKVKEEHKNILQQKTEELGLLTEQLKQTSENHNALSTRHELLIKTHENELKKIQEELQNKLQYISKLHYENNYNLAEIAKYKQQMIDAKDNIDKLEQSIKTKTQELSNIERSSGHNFDLLVNAKTANEQNIKLLEQEKKEKNDALVSLSKIEQKLSSVQNEYNTQTTQIQSLQKQIEQIKAPLKIVDVNTASRIPVRRINYDTSQSGPSNGTDNTRPTPNNTRPMTNNTRPMTNKRTLDARDNTELYYDDWQNNRNSQNIQEMTYGGRDTTYSSRDTTYSGRGRDILLPTMAAGVFNLFIYHGVVCIIVMLLIVIFYLMAYEGQTYVRPKNEKIYKYTRYGYYE